MVGYRDDSVVYDIYSIQLILVIFVNFGQSLAFCYRSSILRHIKFPFKLLWMDSLI